MRRGRTNDGMLMAFAKPFCVVLIFTGLFGLVWLRSSVVREAYAIHALEESKASKIKETKMLLARRAELVSIEHLGVAMRGEDKGRLPAEHSAYVFPARSKVVHLKSGEGAAPYKASYKVNVR